MHSWIVAPILSAIKWGCLWTEMRDLEMNSEARRVAFSMNKSWKNYRDTRAWVVRRRKLKKLLES